MKEETGLDVTRAEYLFSEPNKYLYSGFNIPTLDIFYHCEVADTQQVKAMDDALEYVWMATDNIQTEQFGLRSIRNAVRRYVSGNVNI